MDTNNGYDDIKKELNFYKSIFKTHNNSCLFNMYIKTLNGEKIWVDMTRDSNELIRSLDKDEEVERWLKPVKCER